MELISEIEPVPRSFYGGSIGFLGQDGSIIHAIVIRSFMAKNCVLTSQAGMGIVIASDPDSEVAEGHTKLAALRKAIQLAKRIGEMEDAK